MKCPKCEQVVRGPTCTCGWKPDAKTASAKFKSCGWTIGERQCRAIATINTGRWLCLWHHIWASASPWTGLNEHEEFTRWVQQFHAGGMYADNPGQWRHPIKTLWPLIQGEAMKA